MAGYGIKKAGQQAGKLLNQGMQYGEQILPEVFNGQGFDKTTFQNVNPNQASFDSINQFLDPSVKEAMALQGDITGQYDELLGLRKDKLGGLDSAENSAMKEALFRQIDREKQGAMRDVARTQGLGAGASFGQRRALGRDFREAGLNADRNLLLTNIDVKRQALNDYGQAIGDRTGALGNAQDRVSALRGLQATGQQATDQFNINNQNAADQFNSTGQFQNQQFNAGQQQAELGAKVGAISAGTGLVSDKYDDLQAKKQKQELMDYLAEKDQTMFQQAQQLFG